MTHDIERDGFAIIRAVLLPEELAELISTLGPVNSAGRRGLLAEPAVRRLADSERLLSIVRPHVPEQPRPVRAIYFDKTPDANWHVSWHQDLTVTVRARADVSGFGPWSVKEGVPHVQPPIELMEQMLTVRLHLDHADAASGTLRVLPGSHRCGRLSLERIRELRKQGGEVICTAVSGDALLMRPLLLHGSALSKKQSHRRVLHIEYAGFQLPSPLEWHEGF